MDKILLVILLIIAIAMIVIGVKASMVPPTLTGVGFILIALLFRTKFSASDS